MKEESKRTRIFRRNKKAILIEIAGGRCAICGYNKCQSALEFHHIDKDQKEFNISSPHNFSLEKCLKELKKCILVCSNCHREIHAGLLDNINLWDLQYYNEYLAKEELDKLKSKEYFCNLCGKKIKYKAKYCIDCRKKYIWNSPTTERPSKEKLKYLIRNKTFTEIGKMYNLSDNAIRKWCDKYNLPRTKKEIKSYSDEEWKKI